MRRISLSLLAFVLFGCGRPAVPPPPSQAKPQPQFKATIAVSKAVFDLTVGDEIQVFLTATNTSAKALPSPQSRPGTEFLINGVPLKDSSLIFGSGPQAGPDPVPPGETVKFGYMLTKYFSRGGTYNVAWRGMGFASKPVEFQVSGRTK